MYAIKAFYFPTRIILVDDDPAFLQVLSSKLSEKFLVKTFNNPQEALAYLQKTQSFFNTISPSALVDEELEYGERYLSPSKMNMLADNKEKYDMLTVIISDYVMPGMNGIEFFEKIYDFPVMKILLTGNADLDLALYAFNRGIVNKFLVKNPPKLVTEVEKNIFECQEGFFCKFSYPVLNSLNVSEDSMLRRSALSLQLEKIIHDYDIVEYYLIDNIGSYLLVTKTGQKTYFICIIERQFDEYLDIAVAAQAPGEIIEKLKSRTHAPVFISENDYKVSAKDWERITYSFTKEGRYYYCYISSNYK